MRNICIYIGYIKATTNNQDIRPSVTVKVSLVLGTVHTRMEVCRIDSEMSSVRIAGSGLNFFLFHFLFFSYLLSYSPFILFLAWKTRIRGGMS